jgi:hypothetical protein
MRTPWRTLFALPLAAALATSCKKPEEAVKPPSLPSSQGEAGGAAADPACVAKWSEEGEAKKIDVGGKSYELKGSKFSELSKDDDDQLTLGLVADIKEDTPDNLANLEAIVKFFKEQKADAIVVDGDLGDDKKQIENALAKLAEADLPVLAIIGNREGRAAFNDAVAAASARFPGVINLNKVRLAVFDDGALVRCPPNTTRPASTGGRLPHGPGDPRPPSRRPGGAGKTLVLVSHGPLAGVGADARIARSSRSTGDPACAIIGDNAIKFGVFANIHEAGGRATTLNGQCLIGENKLVDEMYVSTGPADSVRWTMNDGTESVGMASLMMIKGDKASYKVFRVPHKAAAPAQK